MADSIKDIEKGPADITATADSTADDGNQSTVAPSGHETDKADPNIVDWDGPDDPENPLNWPSAKRNLHIALVSVFTLNA